MHLACCLLGASGEWADRSCNVRVVLASNGECWTASVYMCNVDGALRMDDDAAPLGARPVRVPAAERSF